jgi:hypothetical protein
VDQTTSLRRGPKVTGDYSMLQDAPYSFLIFPGMVVKPVNWEISALKPPNHTCNSFDLPGIGVKQKLWSLNKLEIQIAYLNLWSFQGYHMGYLYQNPWNQNRKVWIQIVYRARIFFSLDSAHLTIAMVTSTYRPMSQMAPIYIRAPWTPLPQSNWLDILGLSYNEYLNVPNRTTISKKAANH